MRYRKENGQWLPTTPIGVSREEFDEVKQDLTHFVGGDEWTQRTYNQGEVCIHNNIAWECLATTTVEPSASATTYWRKLDLKNLSVRVDNRVTKPPYSYEIPFYGKNNEVTNCNEMTRFGVYQVQGASNAPDGVTGWITVMVIPMGNDNTGYCRQLIFTLGTNKIYSRYRNGGTWTSWVSLHS